MKKCKDEVRWPKPRKTPHDYSTFTPEQKKIYKYGKLLDMERSESAPYDYQNLHEYKNPNDLITDTAKEARRAQLLIETASKPNKGMIAHEIELRMRSVGLNLFRVGELLYYAKTEACKSEEEFIDFIRDELEMSEPTARNFMNVYESFYGREDIIPLFKNKAALYEIARPSFPKELRDLVIETGGWEFNKNDIIAAKKMITEEGLDVTHPKVQAFLKNGNYIYDSKMYLEELDRTLDDISKRVMAFDALSKMRKRNYLLDSSEDSAPELETISSQMRDILDSLLKTRLKVEVKHNQFLGEIDPALEKYEDWKPRGILMRYYDPERFESRRKREDEFKEKMRKKRAAEKEARLSASSEPSTGDKP